LNIYAVLADAVSGSMAAAQSEGQQLLWK
jgi:hypothetical protein